jgi:hypothetical protein
MDGNELATGNSEYSKKLGQWKKRLDFEYMHLLYL